MMSHHLGGLVIARRGCRFLHLLRRILAEAQGEAWRVWILRKTVEDRSCSSEEGLRDDASKQASDLVD